MPNHSATTPKGTRILRIERAGAGRRYLSASWYFLTSENRKTTYFPLGKKWSDACKKADEIRAFLDASGSVEEAIQRFRKAPPQETARLAAAPAAVTATPFATLDDILLLLSQQNLALGLRTRTFHEYRNSLLRVVRRALKQRNGRDCSVDEALQQSAANPKLWSELEAWAADELRSVNGQIEFVLRQAVQKRKRTQSPEAEDERKR